MFTNVEHLTQSIALLMSELQDTRSRRERRKTRLPLAVKYVMAGLKTSVGEQRVALKKKLKE